MSNWINFRELREKLDFALVLEYFGVEVKRKGNRHRDRAPLPLHVGERKASTFSAELERGIFQCFGCRGKGNVLEFAALMREVDLNDGQGMRRVALELQEKFFGEPVAPPKAKPAAVPIPAKSTKGVQVVAVNAPLDFELKGLDHDHPYVQGRGITGETARYFGIGVALRGTFQGRLAIPIHDHENRLVGYAGRVTDDSTIRDDNPKYRFPERRERNGATYDFRKAWIVYNANRIKAPLDELIVVEGFTAVWWFHQAGYPNTVALMGNNCSERQGLIIAGVVKPSGRVWILPDGDEAGVKDAESMLGQIAAHRFCRWVRLPKNARPTDVSVEGMPVLFR